MDATILTPEQLTAAFETLADEQHHPRVFRASERIRQHLVSVTQQLAEAQRALQPFARYLAMREAKPLPNSGDVIHAIHPGTPSEAELTLEHCRAAREALRCHCRRTDYRAALLAPGCHFAGCPDAQRQLTDVQLEQLRDASIQGLSAVRVSYDAGAVTSERIPPEDMVKAPPVVAKTKPLSANQRAALNYIQAIHRANGQPVPLSLIRGNSGLDPRHLTGTLASLIDRGLIRVPIVGTAAYTPT